MSHNVPFTYHKIYTPSRETYKLSATSTKLGDNNAIRFHAWGLYTQTLSS